VKLQENSTGVSGIICTQAFQKTETTIQQICVYRRSLFLVFLKEEQSF